MLLRRATTALLATSLPIAIHALVPRTSICTEGPQLICYDDSSSSSAADGDPPSSSGSSPPPSPPLLSRAHVQHIADYLRWLGNATTGSPFWTMPAEAAGCAEWTLPVPDAGPVLPLAKHVRPWRESSVLYADVAAAVEGVLAGCEGRAGGQVGVSAGEGDGRYGTEEYRRSGATPEGILVKLVRAPPPPPGSLGGGRQV